jgi:FlgD Ig-like domain
MGPARFRGLIMKIRLIPTTAIPGSSSSSGKGKPNLRPCLFALVLTVILVLAPGAQAVAPVLVSPVDGTEVPSGFTGPVQVAWQEAGEMKIEVTGPQPGQTILSAVTPEQVGGTAEYTIGPLTAAGTYTIAAGRADGTEPLAQVAVTVPEPPPPPNEALVIAPAHEASVLQGWRGPIKVRWRSVARPGATYSVFLGDRRVCSFKGGVLTPGEVTSCMLGFTPGVGARRISVVEAGAEVIDRSTVNIKPHLRILSRSASPLVFWPFVRDSYRDTTRFSFRLNQPARTAVRVMNADGRVVRTVSLGTLTSGSWRWNGRTNSGRKVNPGFFRDAHELARPGAGEDSARHPLRAQDLSGGRRARHHSVGRLALLLLL